jgi:hypothetical protein
MKIKEFLSFRKQCWICQGELKPFFRTNNYPITIFRKEGDSITLCINSEYFVLNVLTHKIICLGKKEVIFPDNLTVISTCVNCQINAGNSSYFYTKNGYSYFGEIDNSSGNNSNILKEFSYLTETLIYKKWQLSQHIKCNADHQPSDAEFYKIGHWADRLIIPHVNLDNYSPDKLIKKFENLILFV